MSDPTSPAGKTGVPAAVVLAAIAQAGLPLVLDLLEMAARKEDVKPEDLPRLRSKIMIPVDDLLAGRA